MPECIITVKGDIESFPRIDNLYAAVKRETEKMLKNWKLSVDVKFEVSEGEEEIPK